MSHARCLTFDVLLVHVLHRIRFASLIALTLPAAVLGSDSELVTGKFASPPSPRVAGFYCQDPYAAYSVNASSAFNSELADDIQRGFEGAAIHFVTLYVSEWIAPWQAPSGIRIRFYNGNCPPPLAPTIEFNIPWGDISSSQWFHHPSIPLTIYEAIIPLPTPVTIETRMALGCTVIMDWGQVPPFCGFTMTDPNVIFGGCEASWDFPPKVPRWTPISVATGGDAHDLAYCLSGGSMGIGDPAGDSLPDIDRQSTWGRTKSMFHR